MQDLTRTLTGYDLELLRVIANRWDVDLNARDTKQAGEKLAQAMLQEAKVSDIWDRLTDEQRGAMQTLLGSGARMPNVVFSRMFGEIRPMGPGRMEREKPYLNPVSLAEALYYRGLIANTFGEGVKGNQTWVFVPTDLAALMPVHRTGYKAETPPAPVVGDTRQPALVSNIRQGDTALVDDLTTFLAYCQVNDLALIDGAFPPDHQKAIKAYLVGSNSTARLALMIAVANGLGLAADTMGNYKPLGNKARKWLEQPRAVQVRSLAEAWRDSVTYNELWFTPGLKPEKAGWQNDPMLARQTVLTFLEMVPDDGWWNIDDFVSAVKEDEPDFQRPAGDYDSWYIRDSQTNQYLRGFDNWDKVDGALLRFILIGPMNGLGLVDTADNGKACRLTVYGRAFTETIDWPTVPDEEVQLTIQPDGVCELPRAASRFDRFQLARFTDWIANGKAGEPYQYRLSTAGLDQAGRQGIEANNIVTFLDRASGNKVPETISNLIEMWGHAGQDAAVIGQMTVLRVPNAELLETIQATPALRRYLGMTLGPTAVVVRPGQWHDLAAALEANGVLVNIEVADNAQQ